MAALGAEQLRRLVLSFATGALLYSLLWLPLKDGGNHQATLSVAQVLMFTALIALILTKTAALPRNRWVMGALALSIGGVVISTILSLDLDASFPSALRWLWVGAAGLVASSVIHDEKRFVGLIAVLLGAAIIQVGYGFILWQRAGDAHGLQSGTFYAPNQYAGFLVLLAPLVLVAALTEKGVPRAIGWGVLAAIVYLAIALSGSRGGVAAALIGLATTVIVLARQSVKRSLMRLGLVAVLFIVIGVWVTGPLLFPHLDQERRGPLAVIAAKDNVGVSVEARLEFSRGALRMGADRPLWGYGPGTFGDGFFRFGDPKAAWSKYAHNHYLEAFAEGGILLALGVIALPVAALLAAPRPLDRWRLGLAAGLLGSSAHLLVDYDWSFPGFAVVYVVVTITVAIKPQEVPRLMPRPLAVPLALISAAVAVVVAVAYEPFATRPRLQQADDLVRLGSEADLRRAEDVLAEAISFDQLDLPLRWKLAVVEQRLGRTSEARRIYEEVLRRAPNAIAAYVFGALFELEVNNYAAAHRLANKGIELIKLRADEDLLKSSLDELMRIGDCSAKGAAWIGEPGLMEAAAGCPK